jgi:uncharacterized protein (TIGR02266 family)
MKSEKRQSKRVPLKLKVDYHYEGNFLYEYATDISHNGIFIESKDPLPIGTQVTLQFSVPEQKKPMELSGTVMWVNSKDANTKNPGMGVQFNTISDLDKDTITSLIRRLAVL